MSRIKIRAFLGKTKQERKATLKEIAYRRRYVVPNLVTVGNMFCGYLAIMYAVSNRIQDALIAITIALLLDGLDGRVARKLNATSPFGMEFDSFSDLVSFGIAPAIVMYYWGMHRQADQFGIIVTFLYALCAASRLARFNLDNSNLQGFTGLPTPGAAGAVVALIHFVGVDSEGDLILVLTALTMVTLAVLMIASVEFLSIKVLKLQGMKMIAQILLGATIALIWYSSRVGLFFVAFSYCLSGPVRSIFFQGYRKNLGFK